MAAFNKDEYMGLLNTKFIGRNLVYTDVTGSTMDDAWRYGHKVTEFSHGTVVLSERQTKARGARDHKWDASNSGNIYASFILHLPPLYKSFEGRFDLEVAACLSVLQVVRKFGVKCAVPKWPNDVWVRGHKLAGFLAEDGKFNIPGSLNCLMVLGIGINVNSDVRRSPDLSSIATSIRCELAGQSVNRERFFAEVCASLEQTLQETRETNLDVFRHENLFQTFQDIIATCPSEGCVIDGKFLEICDNWDIKLSDKKNEEIFQGRSDYFTIRPKVSKKILVVFTDLPVMLGDGDGHREGGGGSGEGRKSDGDNSGDEECGAALPFKKSAQLVASMLQTLMDTSKHVICLVPESFICNTDDWMKTSSLLVFPEPLSNPDKVTSKLNQFLCQGGRALASGMGAPFLANVVDIPAKEIQPVSSLIYPESSSILLKMKLSHIEAGESTTKSDSKVPANQEATSTTGSSSTQNVTFLTSKTCFHFLYSDSVSSSKAPSDCKSWASYYEEAGAQSSQKIAACTVNLSSSRAENICVGLIGFDLGSNVSVLNLGTKESQQLEDDRFKRDFLLQQIVEFLLK